MAHRPAAHSSSNSKISGIFAKGERYPKLGQLSLLATLVAGGAAACGLSSGSASETKAAECRAGDYQSTGGMSLHWSEQQLEVRQLAGVMDDLNTLVLYKAEAGSLATEVSRIDSQSACFTDTQYCAFNEADIGDKVLARGADFFVVGLDAEGGVVDVSAPIHLDREGSAANARILAESRLDGDIANLTFPCGEPNDGNTTWQMADVSSGEREATCREDALVGTFTCDAIPPSTGIWRDIANFTATVSIELVTLQETGESAPLFSFTLEGQRSDTSNRPCFFGSFPSASHGLLECQVPLNATDAARKTDTVVQFDPEADQAHLSASCEGVSQDWTGGRVSHLKLRRIPIDANRNSRILGGFHLSSVKNPSAPRQEWFLQNCQQTE